MNNHKRLARWMLTVVAAVPASWSVSAWGQARQDAAGHVLDSPNQIGGSGYNTATPGMSAGQFGNDIVSGNVTGGRYFRGNTPSSAFDRFHAGAPLNFSDTWVRKSNTSSPNAIVPSINTPTSFYGDARATPPPVGYVKQSSTGGLGFVPSAPLSAQAQDLRLGDVLTGTNPAGVTTTAVPKSGDTLLPGPVDATAGASQSILSASPLYGIRTLNANDAADQNFLNRFTGGRTETAADRAGMTQKDVERIRREMHNAARQQDGDALNQPPMDQNLAQPMVQPFDAPTSGALASKPLTAAAGSTVAVSGAIGTEQSAYSRVLGSAAQQSKQYDELRKRLDRYTVEKRTVAEEATRQFNAAMKAKRDAEAKAAAAGVKGKTPIAAPAVPGATDTNTPNPQQPAKPAPLKVPSLAPGMNSKGLADMLKKAEDLMKEGKFTAAIDEYSAAEQVVPNQPLIWIGRANAELGAAYYGRAEVHIRDAFTKDKSLLMAQYDLRAFLGEERLQAVIKDLKEIAQNDAQSITPVFLLAYVAYNTGNEQRAAGYLDLAEKRAGGKDPIYKILREHWSLPTTDPKSPVDLKELNK